MCVCWFISVMSDSWTLWAILACQAPLSMGFSRKEYWSGLPCPSPADLPNPEIQPMSPGSPAVTGRFFTTSTTWEAHFVVAAAASKSLQLCPTLCDPIDGSPPGSPIPGILQAKTLERVAISFSSAWKWKVKVKLLSHVRLFVIPWTAAYQAPLSMGFSRQEYWSGVPLPSPQYKIKSKKKKKRKKIHWFSLNKDESQIDNK